MTDSLSLSIFTIESDRKPVLAFAVKKHEDADAFFRDEVVRTKLRSANSSGVPLCDGLSILRLRLTNADERARHREEMAERSPASLAAIFLVDVDAG
ncbi:hypothetical protein [Bradyrhizobium sp. S69]|jgi:hypothetical protein|uniref:hypothetical protein n=1 Tax=Bradyrhizobium sp. S69 TaxID=1641856 RepID=UPI00131E17B5|nr:hypothetical protein [Bradyrhizobium sp. S69]